MSTEVSVHYQTNILNKEGKILFWIPKELYIPLGVMKIDGEDYVVDTIFTEDVIESKTYKRKGNCPLERIDIIRFIVIKKCQ